MINNYQNTIICASKYYNTDEIKKIYSLGINDFGENRVDDLINKKKILNKLKITWHFIGKLQTNKIKKVINEIDYLHSLENIRQADFINKYRNQPLKCFIQVNITEEEQKSGINIEKIDNFIKELKKYDKIQIVGFMTIGVNNDLIATENAFKSLQNLNEKYKFPYLSMGMTNDYLIAIKYGTTHLRLGSYFKKYLGG